jgi:ABC-type polysaccharide/polyol phosphate export permease
MATATAPSSVYDSDRRRRPVLEEFANIRSHWGLLRLLVVRDITVRYKRSALGIWWTLLNPLLTTAVMFAVFSQIFRFQMPENEPFVVYLLSGVILMGFFSQGVIAAGSSIVNSAGILTKVYVPPEIFALAAAIAAAVNLFINLIPLLVVQLVVGWGVPWTVVLVPLPVLALLGLVTGVGLLVAAAAVYFYDVLDLTAVILGLVGYLTPTFYPITIVPGRFRPFVEANPLYSYLLAFRSLVYLGRIPPWYVIAMVAGTSLIALSAGVYAFSRSWRRLVVLL